MRSHINKAKRLDDNISKIDNLLNSISDKEYIEVKNIKIPAKEFKEILVKEKVKLIDGLDFHYNSSDEKDTFISSNEWDNYINSKKNWFNESNCNI